VRQFSFPTLRQWPLPLLLVSLGLTAVAAIDAHRALRSQRDMADRAMREFASFAGWSYNERLENRLQAMLRESLGAVNHGNAVHETPPVPSARHLPHYLPFDSRCNCHRTYFGPNPIGMFAFELGDRGRDLDVMVNMDADPHFGWEEKAIRPVARADELPQPRYSDTDKSWIVDTITRETRAVERPHRGFSLVADPASSRVIGYTLMPTAWGDTMVYGAEYSREGLSSVIGAVIDDPGLLPATFTGQQKNSEVIAVRVSERGRHGAPLFESETGTASPFGSHIEMAPHYGRLALDVFVRPERVNTLVTPGVLPSTARLPFVLAVLGLAAAMSVVAVVQLRREAQIARMRSEFVANVSHELRTPLAQIKLYTETLLSGRATSPEQRSWSLGHIDRETTRLTSLVDNVLRFSRAEATVASPIVQVDVSGESARIVEAFRLLAASRNVTVRERIQPGIGARMQADALPRILLNLLDNAVKYGPPGQTVDVSVAALDGQITIAVSDEGPGVLASERESIWRAFARGSAASIAAGSGIGLSVVREIALQHGGSARVEDAPSRGARFIVSIPVSA
jgi:signal transduction histidine kinase